MDRKALENDIRSLALKAQETVAGDLTMAEKKTALVAIREESEAKSSALHTMREAERLEAGADGSVEQTSNKSFAQQIVEDESYKAFADSVANGGRGSAQVQLKANMVDGALTGEIFGGNAGPSIYPNFLPGMVGINQRPIRVTELFAQGTTDSPVIVYLKENTWNNNAAPVAEGGTKPQTDGSVVRVVEQVKKLAHTMDFTDEMLADASAYASILQNKMVLGLQLREENDLLNGNGAGATLSGLLNRSAGFATPVTYDDESANAGQLLAEAIHQQITAISTSAFTTPDTVLMNPAQWQTLRLAKDANNQYFSGGPFQGSYGGGLGLTNVHDIWGYRVVVSTIVPAGTVVIGSFGTEAQIFRRQGITVDMTNSHASNFKDNITTVRAEERLAFALYRPGAFGLVTGDA